jgi:hypothetical protein
MKTVKHGTYFWQGNEACAEAAVISGCKFYAGYPITPASEISELLSKMLPKVKGIAIQNGRRTRFHRRSHRRQLGRSKSYDGNSITGQLTRGQAVADGMDVLNLSLGLLDYVPADEDPEIVG